MKEKERKAQEEEDEEGEDGEAPSTKEQAAKMSFEKLWCEGWESPCVETTVRISKKETSDNFLTSLRSARSVTWRTDESWR